MTLEDRYKAQLTDMGIYRPAFDPEIKTLAQMERELRRVDKAWREAGSSYTDELFSVRATMRKDILTHREALGLTPKGFKRLRPEQTGAPTGIDPHSAALEALEAKCAAYG